MSLSMDYYIKHLLSPTRYIKKILILFLVYLFIPCQPQSFAGEAGRPQEAKIHQKKIDKERAKKEKEGQKQYEKAVKRHMDNQSKETKIMMKKARKEAKKNTPLK